MVVFELIVGEPEKTRVRSSAASDVYEGQNRILGRLEEHLDETYTYRCLVGGLPVERAWPWEYKAAFSPGDVIQIYMKPARLRREGVQVTLPALSEVDLADFAGLGTLEAFHTDGLRSLLKPSKTPEMVDKTMRHPGHAENCGVSRRLHSFPPPVSW